jgi:hypothetical protein
LNQPENPVPVLCSISITVLLLLGKGPLVFFVCLIEIPSIHHNSPIHYGGLVSPLPIFFCLAFPTAHDSHLPSEPRVIVQPK